MESLLGKGKHDFAYGNRMLHLLADSLDRLLLEIIEPENLVEFRDIDEIHNVCLGLWVKARDGKLGIARCHLAWAMISHAVVEPEDVMHHRRLDPVLEHAGSLVRLKLLGVIVPAEVFVHQGTDILFSTLLKVGVSTLCHLGT